MLRTRGFGFGSLWLLLLPMLDVTGCSRGPDNAQLAAAVQNKILGDRRVKAMVHVSSNDGIITLSGRVADRAKRATAARDAAQIEGVRVVVDNLEVSDAEWQPRNATVQKPLRAASRPTTRRIARKIEKVNAKGRTPAFDAEIPVNATIRTPAIQPVPAGSTSFDWQFSDTKAATTRATASSAPSPTLAIPPPIAERVTVPGGAVFSVRLMESISSELNQQGDTFRASLASPVMVDDKSVIPAEAAIEGKIVDLRRAGRFQGRSELVLELSRLAYNGQVYQLRTSQYSRYGPSRDIRSAAMIGGGAGIGALIGVIVGGRKGAAIGAVIGGGTGAGVQAASKGADVQLPPESVLSFRLRNPLTVIPSSSLEQPSPTGSGSSPDPLSDWRPVLKRRPVSAPANPSSSDPDTIHGAGSPETPQLVHPR
jgi:hypothetical protein